MPIKGAVRSSSNNPAVHVTIRQPKEDNPFDLLLKRRKGVGRAREGGKSANPRDDLKGLLFLLGIVGVAWGVTRVLKGAHGGVGDLKGAMSKKNSSAPYGVGDVARFRITPENAQRVAAVMRSYGNKAVQDPYVASATEKILTDAGVSRHDKVASAMALHDVVNNQMAVIQDPDGFERIVSPDEMLRRFFSRGVGATVGGDCDDKSLLLWSLFQHAGIPANVHLLDTDGDGVMDHAATIAYIDGTPYFGETVVPGAQLGWAPEIKGGQIAVL